MTKFVFSRKKITPKTKQKMIVRQQKLLAAVKSGGMGGGVKTVIRVNSSAGKQALRKIAESRGKVLQEKRKSNNGCSDEEDEDIQLTCPVCLACYWFPAQTHEHMRSVHNIEHPAKYIVDKSLRK